MNKLILINGQGKEYNLLNSDLSPGFQLDGLGYEDDTEFLRIGNDYYPLEEAADQNVLETTILFMDSSDKRYYEFVKHARHDPLTLLYGNNNGEFYIPCRLRSISKIDQLGIRRYPAPVRLTQMGNMYRRVTAFNPGQVTGGKYYGDNGEGYTYDYTYSPEVLNTVSISSDSYVESPCILAIYGPVTNPIWKHYLNGDLVETGAYAGTVPAGNYLEINPKTMPYSIMEYADGGTLVADRYQLCDFSTDRFVHIGEGENSYVVSHDGMSAVSLRAEGYIEYETV